jgi:predicted ArsR family transcriptional regulator
MEIPRPPDDDVLAQPLRGRLFAALSDLRRPATTQELAERLERPPNTVRAQLQRLTDAGLLERRRMPQKRGRPRHEWAIAADAEPGGEAPRAHDQLGRWLVRALGSDPERLEEIEEAGREIGRELAPAARGRELADAMQDALTALGFQPHLRREDAALRYVLGNCPYREAVRENQPLVCTLHRGITHGLLDKLHPKAQLTGFVARDPDTAGCLIELGEVSAAG